MTRLRVGIVGAAGQVAAVHAQAYRELECIDLVAGADVDAPALAAAAARWGFNPYPAVEEMLQAERLDIACVCVPARYHREVAEKVAAMGVHVLMEKPLATSLADGQAILDACARAGVKLYYGASYRALTANSRAREMIRNGELGDVSMALELVAMGQGLDGYRECGPTHYAPGTPGGCGLGIMDHGIHLVDLFCWFLDDEVDSVFGRGNLSGEAPASEHATITFRSGAVVHLIANTISFAAQLPAEGVLRWGGSWNASGELSLEPGWADNPLCYQVHGSRGAIKVFPYAEQLVYFARDTIKPVRLDHHPMPGNFALQMRSFVDSVVNDRPPAVGGADGLRALKIILAAYESAATQQVVRF